MPLLEFFSRSEPKEVEMRIVKQQTQNQNQKIVQKTNAVNTAKRAFTFDPSDGLPAATKSPQKLAADGKTAVERGSEECTRQRRNSASQLFGGNLADPLLLNSYDQL